MQLRALPHIPSLLDVPRAWWHDLNGEARLFVALAGVGLASVVAADVLAASIGLPMVLAGMLGALALLGLAVALFRWPILGFYLVAIAAVVIDESVLDLGSGPLPLFVFYWPPQLEGFIERPIGVLVLYVFAVLLLRRFALRQPLLEGGKLLIPFLVFLLAAILGLAHGLATGGDLKVAVVEMRPLWYLFVSYVLAYNLVRDRRHVRTFFWILIFGTGFKGLIGVYLYFVTYHSQLPADGSFMAHEESFFFACLLLFLLLQLLHSRYRRQFYAALAVVPFVVFAMVANQRRTTYVALIVGLVVVWILVAMVKPHLRVRLLVALALVLVLGGGYVAAFADSDAALAAPAHELVSVFSPGNNKVLSNAYRDMENYDLQFTAKQSPLLGTGLGQAYQQPEPLATVFPDILANDPYYNYVPHNNIYWILTSLGLVGYGALWYLLGSLIIRGTTLAKRLRDPYLRQVAIFTVGVIFMEVIVAYGDYQLFFYRNVFFVGLLAGLLMRLPAMDTPGEGRPEDVVDEAADAPGVVRAHEAAEEAMAR